MAQRFEHDSEQPAMRRRSAWFSAYALLTALLACGLALGPYQQHAPVAHRAAETVMYGTLVLLTFGAWRFFNRIAVYCIIGIHWSSAVVTVYGGDYNPMILFGGNVVNSVIWIWILRAYATQFGLGPATTPMT